MEAWLILGSHPSMPHADSRCRPRWYIDLQ